jgi:hypothetical protein
MKLPTDAQLLQAMRELVKDGYFGKLSENTATLIEQGSTITKLIATLLAIHHGLKPKEGDFSGTLDELIEKVQAHGDDEAVGTVMRSLTAGLMLGIKVMEAAGSQPVTAPFPDKPTEVQLALAMAEMIKEQHFNTLGETTGNMFKNSPVLFNGMFIPAMAIYLDLAPGDEDKVVQACNTTKREEAGAIGKAIVSGLLMGWKAAKLASATPNQVLGAAIDALKGVAKRAAKRGDPDSEIEEVINATRNKMADNGAEEPKAKRRGGWK